MAVQTTGTVSCDRCTRANSTASLPPPAFTNLSAPPGIPPMVLPQFILPNGWGLGRTDKVLCPDCVPELAAFLATPPTG